MSQRPYSADVEKELLRLTRLSSIRLEEYHLNSIAAVISRWQKDAISVKDALAEIRKFVLFKKPEWAEGADLGVPVAQALADGVLTRADLSDEAWSAIEYLVTLVEI